MCSCVCVRACAFSSVFCDFERCFYVPSSRRCNLFLVASSESFVFPAELEPPACHRAHSTIRTQVKMEESSARNTHGAQCDMYLPNEMYVHIGRRRKASQNDCCSALRQNMLPCLTRLSVHQTSNRSSQDTDFETVDHGPSFFVFKMTYGPQMNVCICA